MFGTLVIQLPSNYTGGKLVVYHQEKKSEFDYSGRDCCGNCYFVSFYADCLHEVEKVTKGYRLCLIYNLMYQGLDQYPTPADNQQQISAIVSAIKQWQEDDTESDDCPGTVTYLLEHKYCEASLSFQLLKNRDRAVADVLSKAKAEMDFDLYVGQIKFTEHWSVDNHERGLYIPLQCEDASVCVEHLRAFGGEYTLSHIDIDKESFVQEDFFDTMDPDEQEYEEATGNEGASLDKQYNWAALLLWPTEKRMTVIGLENMIELFKQDVDAGKKDLDSTARYLMKEMRSRNLEIQSCNTFLLALQEIADTQLIAEVLDVIATDEDSYRFVEDTTFCCLLISISCRYGWDILKSPLQIMFGRCSSDNVEIFCEFLKRMITFEKLGEGKDLCKDLLHIIVRVLTEEEDATLDRSSSSSFRIFQHHRSKEFVSQLFELLTAVGSDDLFASANSALSNKPVRYPIMEILGPAIVDFCKSTEVEKNGGLQAILFYCVSQLEASLQQVVPAPTNNAKPIQFTCSCKDCAELKKFLSHPTQTQCRFSIGKGRRQHLQNQLYRIDVTYETERIGMPHTLVVTKTNETYQREVKKLEQKQEQEQALLASLQPLLAFTDMNEPPIKKQKANSQLVSGSSYIDLT